MKKQEITDKREKILQQGIELLSEHGYHGTGLKLILDSVNVPKGSFYNYFKSKEQFTVEVIQAYSDSIMEKLDAFIDGSNLTPLDTLKAIYHTAMDGAEKNECRKGCLVGDLSAEIGGQSKSCEEALQLAFQTWQDRITNLLLQGQETGHIRTDLSAEQLAELFINQWEGALLRMKVEGNTECARRTLDHMLDTLFKP